MAKTPMTVARLHKLLGKLIASGHGRWKMSIDKASFRSPLLADGVSILDVHEVECELVPVADGDGFTETLANGQEKFSKCAILYGDGRHDEF